MRNGLAALVDLCKLGRRELLARWASNTLTWAQAWTAAMGAAECVARIAAGDAMLSDDEAAARVNTCDGCLSRTVGQEGVIVQPDGSRVLVRSWYCGDALVPVREGNQRTCGCLLASEKVEIVKGRTVRLAVLPVCAARLKDKQCWQGKWPMSK